MNVAHVVPGIGEEASGPSYVVPRLCESLLIAGVNTELHVLTPQPRKRWSCPVHTYPSWPIVPRLGISPRMRSALYEAAKKVDIVHNHGLWMMPNIYPGRATKGRRCRLVSTPHGTLSQWALGRSRWTKRLIWKLWQGKVLRGSACLHATAEHEWRDIRRAGLTAPVVVVPNGVDVPPHQVRVANAHGMRRLLFLSRIHPTKGIDPLLRAWRRLQGKFPEWELHIVGPDNVGYLAEMKELSRSLAAQRVHFPGPVYGEEKGRVFHSAELYILPTHSENFGMTVAEALAHGLPAVVTKGAPWSGLEKEGCGWWVDSGEGPLRDCLEEALSLSNDELAARGRRGRAWMERDFSWERIGRMMSETYQWLLGGGSPPAWVKLD